MSVKMSGLKFSKDKTYYFCLFSTARLLPENFKANGLTKDDYKILPVSNARKLGLIPEDVHIPQDPSEIEYSPGIPARSLTSLCVVISHIEPSSLQSYFPAIWKDYTDRLDEQFSHH